MRAFVAGATGYTGRALVETLCEAGHEVVAHIRPESSRREELGPRFEALGAALDLSPWEDEAIRGALRAHRPDAVFCAIGTTKARMRALEASGEDAAAASYEAVDYGLTRMLAEACADLEPAPRLVYISSMGVSPNGLNAYMKARYRAEQAILTSGAPYTIARPGIITGEDREESRPLERLGGKLNDALFGALGALGARQTARRYRSTDAAELARALVRLAEAPDAANRIVEAQELKDTP